MLLAYLFKNYSVNIQLDDKACRINESEKFKNYSVNIQQGGKLMNYLYTPYLKTTQLIFNL